MCLCAREIDVIWHDYMLRWSALKVVKFWSHLKGCQHSLGNVHLLSSCRRTTILIFTFYAFRRIIYGRIYDVGIVLDIRF